MPRPSYGEKLNILFLRTAHAGAAIPATVVEQPVRARREEQRLVGVRDDLDFRVVTHQLRGLDVERAAILLRRRRAADGEHACEECLALHAELISIRRATRGGATYAGKPCARARPRTDDALGDLQLPG
jgi:hypothetical protein